jgi:DNA-binding transcriptional MerR regulator
MHELLGRLGDDKITLEEFLRRIKQHGMTIDDIDRYLDGTL